MVDFETRLRALLPSMELCKVRSELAHIVVSFGEQRDFLALVRSATGVNIALEVGWMFEVGRSSPNRIGNCYLKLALAGESQEDQLELLVSDLLIQLRTD